MNAILTQCRFEMVRIFRNPYFVFWSLFMPILFYFIFTNIVNTGVPDQGEWQAYYLMSMTTFSVMGSAIMNFGIRMVQEQTEGWSTFMKLTPLPFLGLLCFKDVWPANHSFTIDRDRIFSWLSNKWCFSICLAMDIFRHMGADCFYSFLSPGLFSWYDEKS